jgi:TPR repeat protein
VKAYQWYLTAAKRGYQDAANNLGLLYEAGRGVRENKRKAEFWFRRADPDAKPKEG